MIAGFTGDPWNLERQILVMPGPRPPANSGQTFLAIYGSEWKNPEPDANRGLHERFSVNVCINRKSRNSPYDRTARTQYIEDVRSMSKAAYRVASLIHQNTDVLVEANDDLTANHWINEYLRWSETDPNPIEKPPDWFGLKDDKTVLAGYIMEVKLVDARRVQTFADQTGIQS